ncbi:MAG: GNAT family N-acetyltransferase [Magnetococcales bacterium]|nr:GNAT family N-acetyltransferase [Magnetococcales bacterium]
MTRPLGTPDPDWQTRHAHAIVTPEAAVRRIKPGQRIFLSTGAGAPTALVRALIEQRSRLADIEIVTLFVAGEAPFCTRELAEVFTLNTFFVADNVREMVRQGLADHTPIHLGDIPRLFGSGRMPLNVALISAAPPDADGHVNLGIAVDVVRAAIESAQLVIAQINPHMPVTHGDTSLAVWDIDLLVPAATPLPETPTPEPDETLARIGRNVAALVPDGATIQMGIGRVAQSMIRFLTGKKNLAVHGEMISDTILAPLASGALSGPVVTSFALGSRKLYDTVHANPLFSFRRTEHVNDPRVLARLPRLMAINSALQIDLTGQVCVDSLGVKLYSGLGGIAAFNAGAAACAQGRAIIVLPATARGGKVSRIVARLAPGAGVALNRGMVHYVVSEYGMAYLFGKTIQERALALIGIAHPNFRAALIKRAVKWGYVRPEVGDVDGHIWVGGRELRTSMLLESGRMIQFRSSRPTDWQAVRSMLYSLSEGTVYRRYMSHVKRFPFNRLKNFTFIDQRRDVVVVGTVSGGSQEEVVAIGGYNVDDATNLAEVAFLVRDDWQGQGIGTFMMRHLASVARNAGVAGLTAETLMENLPMQAVLKKSDFPVRTSTDGETVHFEIRF